MYCNPTGNCSLVEKIFLTKYYLSIILNHKYKNGEEVAPYLEDFIKVFDTDKDYPYKYRGAGALHLTFDYGYRFFS